MVKGASWRARVGRVRTETFSASCQVKQIGCEIPFGSEGWVKTVEHDKSTMAIDVKKCRIAGFEFVLILIALGIFEQPMFDPCRSEIVAQADADTGGRKPLRISHMVSVSEEEQPRCRQME